MNRCKRWLALLLGAVLLLGTMSGCSGTTASDSEDGAYRKINLSMAVNGTDTQIDSLVAHHFADLVAERSGGSITIDVFPNDTLAGGNSTKGVEYIAVGAADLGAYATCVLANIEPKMSVATLPWSFTSYQEARQVIDTLTTQSCWMQRASRIWVPSTTASASSPTASIRSPHRRI